MTRDDDLQRLLLAVHALTRIAALDTQSDAPAAQWRTLTLLRDHGPQRLGDLATLSRVTQPGMTRLIRQMDAAGLVSRSSDPDDSRVSVVSPTPAGLAALERWYEQFRAALSPHVADLSEAEWDAVSTAASALSQRVGLVPVGSSQSIDHAAPVALATGAADETSHREQEVVR